MKHSRSSSLIHKNPKLINVPLRSEIVNEYRENLIRNSKALTTERKNIRNSNLQDQEDFLTKAKFTSTQSTFNRAIGISNRIMSSQNRSRQSNQGLLRAFDPVGSRPVTSAHQSLNSNRTGANTASCGVRFNSNSPLSVINDRLASKNAETDSVTTKNDSKKRFCQSSSVIRIQMKSRSRLADKSPKQTFLKKGASTDRGILLNILRSKYRETLRGSVDSYTHREANGRILKQIRNLIPNQLKDIVTGEEMMRMSKILTGVSFRPKSLEHELEKAIEKRKLERKLHYLNCKNDDQSSVNNDEETFTLKSIKRW